MALCLETAALVALHTAMTTGRQGGDQDGRIDGADARVLAEPCGWLLATAAAIRERGSRPGPVPLSAAVRQPVDIPAPAAPKSWRERLFTLPRP